MGWSAIIYGEIALAEGKLAAWRKTMLDAAPLAGCDLNVPKDLVSLVEPTTVEAALSKLPSDPLRFVTFVAHKGTVTIRGVVDEDAFREIATELACVVVASGAHGGKADLYFQSPEEDFLTTVSVRGARVTAATVYGHRNPDGYKAVVKGRKSPGFQDVLATIDKALEARRGPRSPPPQTGTLGRAHAAIQKECVARLNGVAVAPFMDAVADGDTVFIETRPGMPDVARPELALFSSPRGTIGPLTMLGSSKKGILEYLALPFSPCEAAALRALHRLDADAAEPLALRHATEPLDGDLALGVAAALGSRASDASLLATLTLLDESQPYMKPRTFAQIVRTALKTSRNPAAGERALALLDATEKKLPESVMKHGDAATGVASLIDALGALRHEPAVPLLTKLAKRPAFTFAAMTIVQKLKKGAAATGVHFGPRGGLKVNKARG